MGWLADLFGRRGTGDGGDGASPTMPAPPSRTAARPGAPGIPGFRGPAAGPSLAGGGDRQAAARMRLRDAFTPARPVLDPTMFAGREAVLATLIRSIEEQQLHVVVFGDRGIGKTSLLHVLAGQARAARYLVHYASCGETADFGELFREAARAVPLLYHGGYAPTAAESERGGTLADLLPAGAVSARQVADLFARITGTRLLVILDEFDRSPPGAFRAQVAELVKMLSDRSVQAQLVIAGVAANLTELVEHIPRSAATSWACRCPT